MTTYTLQRPVEAKRGTSGREMLPPITEVTLRAPKARDFVELEKAGAFRPGHELQLSVGLAKALIVDPGGVFSVDDLWMGDINGIVETGRAAGFFPSEESPEEESRMDKIEARLTAIEERLSL